MIDPSLTASPRREFQHSNVRVGNHRGMVKSEAFDIGSKAALAQYCSELAADTSKNPNAATVNGFKMTGAHEFLQCLKTLAEQPLPVAVEPAQNLNHRA